MPLRPASSRDCWKIGHLEKTLSFASAVGASCTSALGCTAGVFTFDEALTFVEQQALEIKRIDKR